MCCLVMGLSCPVMESLPGAKFTLHPPSLALSYFGGVTARHLSSGREPNFAPLSTGRRQYSAGRPSRGALVHILVSLDSVMDKYQTGVMSTVCGWPTDVITD